MPFLTALVASTAELVPTLLEISHAVAVLDIQNKVYVSAGIAAVMLLVQFKVIELVVGVPKTTGFPGTDGATARRRRLTH